MAVVKDTVINMGGATPAIADLAKAVSANAAAVIANAEAIKAIAQAMDSKGSCGIYITNGTDEDNY